MAGDVPMSFKENLKKKIKMIELARTVRRSIGPPGGLRKVDKESMRELLEDDDQEKQAR